MSWDGKGFEPNPRTPWANPEHDVAADLRAAWSAPSGTSRIVAAPFDEPSITVFAVSASSLPLRARLRMAWRVLRGRPMFDAEPLSASADAAP